MSRRLRVARVLVPLGLALVLAGCGSIIGDEMPVSSMTQAQRDSAISRSDIPGAAAVARTYRASERQSARNAALDSLR